MGRRCPNRVCYYEKVSIWRTLSTCRLLDAGATEVVVPDSHSHVLENMIAQILNMMERIYPNYGAKPPIVYL